MSREVVATSHKFRKTIPQQHRASLDTRLHWLWHQRFGTVQSVWQTSQNGDQLDHTAATMVLQAIMGRDLDSIAHLFQRIEGAPITDELLLERTDQEEPILA